MEEMGSILWESFDRDFVHCSIEIEMFTMKYLKYEGRIGGCIGKWVTSHWEAELVKYLDIMGVFGCIMYA